MAKATQQSTHARNTLRSRRSITARATPHPSMTGNAASHAQNQIHPHVPIESMTGRPNVNPPATIAATPPAKQGNLPRAPVASISAPESKVTAASRGVMIRERWLDLRPTGSEAWAQLEGGGDPGKSESEPAAGCGGSPAVLAPGKTAQTIERNPVASHQ